MVQGANLADEILRTAIPELRLYEECVTSRLFRSFDSLQEEARLRASERMRLYGGLDAEVAAESAYSEASEWALDMFNMSRGITALLTAGLYHLFEQTAARLFREDGGTIRGARGAEGWLGTEVTVDHFTGWLGSEYSIAVKDCPQWGAIDNELKLIANVAKHAEGRSSALLRKVRPQLFILPSLHAIGEGAFQVGQVLRHPLVGEGIYVGEDDFRGYVVALLAFWNWLAGRLLGGPTAAP